VLCIPYHSTVSKERTLVRSHEVAWDLIDLHHRVAHGDTSGAEGDPDVYSLLLEEPFHHRGDARVHGAPQDEDLSLDEVPGDVGDRGFHRVQVGIEVLVHRCADHDDDVLCLTHGIRIGRGVEQTGVEDASQDFGGLRLSH